MSEPLTTRIDDSRHIDRIVEDYFGKLSSSRRLSGLARRITGNGYDMKLETYQKNPMKVSQFFEPGGEGNTVAPEHKLDRSLPVHIEALAAGLRVPKIIRIVEQGESVHKFTEWIPGNTTAKEMEESPGKLGYICAELGRYAAALHIEGITAVDNHLGNFVWSNRVAVYVDMKKLLYCRDEIHAQVMAKFCLKSCRGDRAKAINFLRGYSEIRGVTSILQYLDEMEWQMGSHRTGRIALEEV